jgi:hypothetical protein
MIETKERFDINYIDASGVCGYHRCPARFMFKRLMGLEHPDRDHKAVDYGTDMHRALPLCYSGSSSEAVRVFCDCWKQRPYGEDDKARNCARAEASLQDFTLGHTPELCPYTIVKYPIQAPGADIISDNEVPFLIDIGGELPCAGRIDVPVRWKAGSTLWALDYKTASEISGRYFENFHFACQSVLYTVALAHIAAPEQVSGMIIEAIRVSGAAKQSVETQLNFVFVQEHMAASMIDFVNATSLEILSCNSIGKWPRRYTGCAPYSMFGQPGRFCEFKSICDVPDWQDAVRFYKRTEPFHPFKVSSG